MNLAFDLDVDIRCTSCGVDRPLPENATRILSTRVNEGDYLFADVDASEACACGGTRVKVAVRVAG